jgi:hypothetical protein
MCFSTYLLRNHIHDAGRPGGSRSILSVSANDHIHALRARPAGRAGVLAVVTLALTGCGSTAPTKTAAKSSTTATQSLALAPAQKSRPRVKPVAKLGSTRSTSTTATKPAASTLCPTSEKRTATGLCYNPAAQTKLVTQLGPCPVGQVVADNGACQPLTSSGPGNQPSLPARCRRPHRADCVLRGSLQGGGLKVARSPGFDTVFH